MNFEDKDFRALVKNTFGEISEENSEIYAEYNEALKKEKIKFILQKQRALWSAQFRAEELGEEMKNIKDLTDKYHEKGLLLQATRRGQLYIWLTINPKPKVILEDFLKKLDTFVKRKMFLTYYYVIEQRGATAKTRGNGFHAHLLLKRNVLYPPSKILKNSMNTFKNVCNTKKRELFNFNWCPSEFLGDKIEYMKTGGKTDDGKDKKQLQDINFRLDNKIEPYYTNTEIAM